MSLGTLKSKDLQNMVSRAIRASARESFIRLLTVENLDKNLPAEIDRLNALKAITQSKWRFQVHRRTMLLQALNSSSGTFGDKDKDSATLVSQLTGQLSQAMAECDKLMEELLRIADQLAQVTKLVDTHWASALAIALRKVRLGHLSMVHIFDEECDQLNTSYGKRTTELVNAREKIAHLEAELDEAWQEAEKLAREMDDFTGITNFEDEGEAVIEVAEIVSMRSSPSPPPINTFLPSPESVLRLEVGSPQQPFPSRDTSPIHVHPDVESPCSDSPPSPGGRSIRSTRTTRSNRTNDASRVNSVSAARRRSIRTSMGSLRFTHSRKSSLVRGKASEEEQPPVPELPRTLPPSAFTPNINRHSFLQFESRSSSPVFGDLGLPLAKRTSIDDIQIVPRSPKSSYRPIVRDDISVMPSVSRFIEDVGIEAVPRRSSQLEFLGAKQRFPSEGKYFPATHLCSAC